MRVDNEEAVFNVYKAIQLPRQYEELSMISVMEIDEQLITPSVYLQDSLEKTIVLFESLEINHEVEEMKHTLNATYEYIKGFNPFFQGLRLPGKAFLMLWPLCALCAIPQIGRFEITGNVIVDALILGLFNVLAASLITAGCIALEKNTEIDKGLITVWLIGSFFLAVIIRAIIWALE